MIVHQRLAAGGPGPQGEADALHDGRIGVRPLKQVAGLAPLELFERIAAHRHERRIDPLDQTGGTGRHPPLRLHGRQAVKDGEETGLQLRRRCDPWHRRHDHRRHDILQSCHLRPQFMVKPEDHLEASPLRFRHAAGNIAHGAILEEFG